MRAIRFSIESRLENLAILGVAIRAVCSQAGMDETDSYQSELAVIESATNAIKYAYGNKPGYQVDVILTVDQGKIEFRVEDSGAPMKSNGKSWTDFDPMKTGSLPESGMGLYIVRQTMDEVSYGSVDGRNVMTMARYLKET
ncbi:MAG: ATP-binding protein [Nitrospiraceae bacterium]|nr:ATP-binding protein [Nitrospiraceae bacterium]